jgi:sugar-specific transcriptional regulator TrmB
MFLAMFEDDYQTFKELGLSYSQTKVYQLLASTGALTASEVARITKIARPHVYGTLAELEEAGLLSKVIGQPERFQALNIVDGISVLLGQRLRKTAEIQEKAAKLIQNFKVNQLIVEAEASSEFVLVRKRDTIFLKSKKMLENAEKSIFFLHQTRRMISWLSECMPEFEKALAREVECKLVIPKPEATLDIWKTINELTRYPNFELKLLPKEAKFGFSIWDNKEILLTTSPYDSSKKETRLWSNNIDLVGLCKEHFELIWNKAKHPASNIKIKDKQRKS